MQPQTKPGRPIEADKRQIAQVALQLFEQRGFEAVTMEEVARAASVSRRTLFRHFPAKADLVWTGADDVLGALKMLAAPHEGRTLPLRAIVSELVAPVLASLDDPAAAELARRRLKLVARAPTLLTHPMLRDVRALLESLLDVGTLPRGASAPLVVGTLVAAAFAAVQWWAEHGEGESARETVLAALHGLATAVEGATPRSPRR